MQMTEDGLSPKRRGRRRGRRRKKRTEAVSCSESSNDEVITELVDDMLEGLTMGEARKGLELNCSVSSGDDAQNELLDSIVRQIEFYFSDANITTDTFLLNQIQSNEGGYGELFVDRMKLCSVSCWFFQCSTRLIRDMTCHLQCHFLLYLGFQR